MFESSANMIKDVKKNIFESSANMIKDNKLDELEKSRLSQFIRSFLFWRKTSN